MTSDRAKKLLRLALETDRNDRDSLAIQRKWDTQHNKKVSNYDIDACDSLLENNSVKATNSTNNIFFECQLPLKSGPTIVPLENIENISLVQNALIEICSVSELSTTDQQDPITQYDLIPEVYSDTLNLDLLLPDIVNDKPLISEHLEIQDSNIIDFTAVNLDTLDSSVQPCINVDSIPQSNYINTECNVDALHITSIDNNCDIDNCDIISNISEDMTKSKLVPYSSSSGEDSDSALPKKSKSRKRRSEVDKSTWFAEKNKRLREKGCGYYGKIKKDSKWVYDAEKEPKCMKNRCNCSNQKGVIKCATVTDDDRKKIFDEFWKKYTWGEKKIFVNDTVQSLQPKRQRDRKEAGLSRRTQSLIYNLKIDDQYVRVCKTMYLNTLGIGRMTILIWKEKMKKACTPSKLRTNKERDDPFAERHKSMIEFLDSLPTMESHYCRSSSSRRYLQPEWNTKMDLYKFYKLNWCETHNVQALSKTTFFEAMSSRNLSLFRPKKDECELCTGYKNGTVEESNYQTHKQKKEEARKEKQKDKENINLVFTVDLQAVLLAPKSNVSTLYYKTKLQVHNLCFYNNINKDGFCYVWNESEGALNADEFASIWMYFLEREVLSRAENSAESRIVIYSDGCGYQNRNVTMANALLNVAIQNNVTIEQKYLEVGHTQMEVDAMHSLIERKMRDRNINVPADYVEIIKSARKKPFKVTYLEHGFFKEMSSISTYKSIRPGRSVGDPKVTDIRALMYSPTGTISYKLRFGDAWTVLPQRKTIVSAKKFGEMADLHKSRLKIKARKYNDLQTIKSVLPADFREFYDNLPHD